MVEFFVYDNIHTYEKMHPAIIHYPETNLKVKQIAITDWGAFWFETDFNREDHNVNINKPYLHLHKGIKSMSEMQFDKDPYMISMKDVIYNPKTRCIEIYKPGSWSWNPFRKPIFVKRAKNNYYGSELPLRKTKALGEWFYDNSNQFLHIILNYYPGYRNLKY